MERVDEEVGHDRGTFRAEAASASRERVVVAVSGGPESIALMRRGAQIASRSADGEWSGVYVSRSDALTGVSTASLEQLRESARDLGGSFHAVVAPDVVEGLLGFARGVNATSVLVGASRRSRLAALLRPGTGERMIAESGDLDVRVVSHDLARRDSRARRGRDGVGRTRLVGGYLLAVIGTAALVLGLYLTPDLHGLPTEALLMLALVVAVALVGGLVPAVLAALLGSLCLNFFFAAPTGTLAIADLENAVAIAVFVVTGIAVATVVDRAARTTGQAVRARSEANALAVLSHNLLGSTDHPVDLLERACEVSGMTGASVLVLHPDQSVTVEVSVGSAPLTVEEADVDVALSPGVVLAFRGRPLEASARSLLTAYATSFAVLRERERARLESQRAAELAEGNRTRTALLAAVSHDLRSPLSAVKAAVSSLRGGDISWSEQDEAELLATIEDGADRLDTLITNLLDMSRLQMGSVNPLITDLDLRSAVEWALGPISGSERVEVALTDGATLVQVDPGLLDRVIANVVENALRHTPPGSPVEISSSASPAAGPGRRVALRVVDHGPGVPASSLDLLFAPFQRLGDVPNGDGLGLGLAVARGLTTSMGGAISAEQTPGGGLTLVIDLPAGHGSSAFSEQVPAP